MKKFLSILLIITMAFSITACGSVENGTKGTVEGNGFVATWSKAFMGSTIKLTIKGSEKNGNIIRDGYEITEEANNFMQDSEGNMIVPVIMDKKIGKDTLTYTLKPIKECMTEQGAYMDILVKDALGTDVITAFVISCKVSKELPLSISITDADMAKLYVNVPVSGDGLYAVGFYNTANGVEIAINNPDGDTWSVLEYDKQMFEVGSPDYRDMKVFIPITALKEGASDIIIKNLEKGVKYKLRVGVAAYYNEAGEFVNFNTKLLSVEGITEQTKVTEAKGYTKAKKAAEQMGISEEFEGIEIPEGFNITEIEVAGGTEDPGEFVVPGTPGQDTPGTDTPGKDTPGEDTPGKDTPGKADPIVTPITPGQDTPVTPDKPGKDEPGKDEPGKDGPGKDEPGKDEPGTDEPGTDTPGKDTPGKDEPGKDKPGKDEPGQNIVITPTYKEIIEKEKKKDKRLEELEKALENDDPNNPVFESEEAKEEYRKALEEEKKNMDMPERVSSDNTNYSMIQCNLVDDNGIPTALILTSEKEVSRKVLKEQYEGYREVFPDLQIKDVKVGGFDVTIVFANGFAAALFTKQGLNYVYEQMDVNFTEAQAIAQVERYIGLNAGDVSKFAQH